MFEFLDHTGDTAVRLTADDEEGLVQSAVDALRCIYLGDEASAELVTRVDCGLVDRTTSIDVWLETDDGESLLVDFLSELIFRFDTLNYLCAHIEIENVSLEPPEAFLVGKLVGAKRPKDLEIRTEIKAATYHGMRIRRDAGKLTVDVVFDL